MTTTPAPPIPPPSTGSPNTGPIGEQRSNGKQILWAILTLGIYGVYWVYVNQEEIKVHSNQGVGGVVGAIIFVFVGIVTVFLLPIEIQKMYEQDGKQSPVTAATAFWILLFGIPWYVKCQNALNEYWASKGAPAPA
ncbi:MAG TPA: DUF4234 domain-containing protein [Acidimicrobiales bacterium]|jgi:uncharacterized membrane protein YhaH (DUF805 family)